MVCLLNFLVFFYYSKFYLENNWESTVNDVWWSKFFFHRFLVLCVCDNKSVEKFYLHSRVRQRFGYIQNQETIIPHKTSIGSEVEEKLIYMFCAVSMILRLPEANENLNCPRRVCIWSKYTDVEIQYLQQRFQRKPTISNGFRNKFIIPRGNRRNIFIVFHFVSLGILKMAKKINIDVFGVNRIWI